MAPGEMEMLLMKFSLRIMVAAACGLYMAVWGNQYGNIGVLYQGRCRGGVLWMFWMRFAGWDP
jgi:hypothetical protein